MPALPRHCGLWSVKSLSTCRLYAPTKRAIVAGVFAGWACPIKVDLADATNIVFGNVPAPGRDGVPLLDLDFHFGVGVAARAGSRVG